MLARLHDAELTGGENATKRITDELERIGQLLEFDSATQVELRFRELKLNLVWQLQRDDLVDVALTPQIKASICIVLGTLGKFAGQSAGLAP